MLQTTILCPVKMATYVMETAVQVLAKWREDTNAGEVPRRNQISVKRYAAMVKTIISMNVNMTGEIYSIIHIQDVLTNV